MKIGDSIRYIGYDKTSFSDKRSLKLWCNDLETNHEYTVGDYSGPGKDDINVWIEEAGWWYPEDIFEVVTPEEEYDKHDRYVVDALNDEKVYSHEVHRDLELIMNRDNGFYCVLTELIEYLASTYSDKYEVSEPNAFSPKELLTKEVCLFNVSKYLRRYSTTGFEKSGNDQDVLKSIHYLLLALNNNK